MRPPLAVTAAGICAGLLILGACGSDDSSSSSTTAKPTTTTVASAGLTEAKACDAIEALDKSAFGESAGAPDYGWVAFSAGLQDIQQRMDKSVPLAPIVDHLEELAAQQAVSKGDVDGVGEALGAVGTRCQALPGATTSTVK